MRDGFDHRGCHTRSRFSNSADVHHAVVGGSVTTLSNCCGCLFARGNTGGQDTGAEAVSPNTLKGRARV